MDKMKTQELISALADGQLRGEALARGIEAAASDPEGREAWRTYHLVGDVMRSADLGAGTPSDKFLARLQESLRLEKPQAGSVIQPIPVRPAAEAVDLQKPAANDSARWKLVAGVASVAAVAAIGWSVLGAAAPGSTGPQLASAPATLPAAGVVLTGTASGPMIRDERLDKLLAAHRQLGGATALQNPAGFVRNATFEGPGR